MRLGGGHLLAHLLDHLLDVAGVAQDRLQPLDHLGLVADVALHDVHGVVQDVVDRQGHGAVDRLDALRAVVAFSATQQFQRVERHGHVAREDLEELHVAFAERPRLGAFDVERADDFVVQNQRHGQRALGPLTPFEVERVLGRVLAQVALAGGGHEAGDAVVLRVGEQVATGGLGNHAHGQQRLELAGASIEQANLDDVEVQQVLGEVQDVRLQQLDPLFDRHLRQLRRASGRPARRRPDGWRPASAAASISVVTSRTVTIRCCAASRLVEHRRGVHVEVAVVARAQASSCWRRPVASAVWNGQKSGPRISGLPSTA